MHHASESLFPFSFKKKKIYSFIFRERGREGEREEEKHQCLVASCIPPTGDLACNPGMCPDWNQTGNLSVHSLVLSLLSHTT